jgi:proteasome lid subunit RPN8/RPN11
MHENDRNSIVRCARVRRKRRRWLDGLTLNFLSISCTFGIMRRTKKRHPQYVLPRMERMKLHRRALRAQRIDQGEVCGVLVRDSKYRLGLHFLQNRSTEPGRFEISGLDLAAVRKDAQPSGNEVVGTFHSHPISPAVPSRGDLRDARLNSLLLIYDVCGREIRLWRVKRNRTGRTYEDVPISSAIP